MSYAHRRYLLMTHDPTHIGAGGYRIGRVDNSIVREPGTNLPKIPGTSLSGAIRSYAAYRYDKIRCAGQGQEKEIEIEENGEKKKRKREGHCGSVTCAICYTFGYTVKKKSDDTEISYSGTVNIYDAHIVLFPVSSMIGPLWISTKRRLKDFEFTVNGAEPNETSDSETCTLTREHSQPINLGWLMLDVSGQTTIAPPTKSDLASQTQWTSIQDRIALVPESLFSQLVNSGLEVRTSVSINPETGAAESGALFTYEAIPRATFLAFDLVQDDYREGEKPWKPKKEGGQFEDSPVTQTFTKQPLGTSWSEPHQVVQSGLEWASALGIGGMSTRGFGRLGLVGSGWEVQ